MQRRPLSEDIRWVAAASYFFPIGVILLLLPRFREIRLVRYHSIQGTCLFGVTVLSLGLFNLFTALIGSLLGLGFLMFSGLIIIGMLVFSWFLMGISATAAYTGKTNRLPLVTPLANRIEGHFKRRAEAP